MADEKEAVLALVRHMLAEGFNVSVDNGGDGYEITKSTDFEAIKAELFATDEDLLAARKDSYCGIVRCIYGNSPEEIFADYSERLDPYVQKVHKELFPDG